MAVHRSGLGRAADVQGRLRCLRRARSRSRALSSLPPAPLEGGLARKSSAAGVSLSVAHAALPHYPQPVLSHRSLLSPLQSLWWSSGIWAPRAAPRASRGAARSALPTPQVSRVLGFAPEVWVWGTLYPDNGILHKERIGDSSDEQIDEGLGNPKQGLGNPKTSIEIRSQGARR